MTVPPQDKEPMSHHCGPSDWQAGRDPVLSETAVAQIPLPTQEPSRPGYKDRTLLESSGERQGSPALLGNIVSCHGAHADCSNPSHLVASASRRLVRFKYVWVWLYLHSCPPSVTLCAAGLKFNRKKKYKDMFYNIEYLLNQAGQNHNKIENTALEYNLKWRLCSKLQIETSGIYFHTWCGTKKKKLRATCIHVTQHVCVNMHACVPPKPQSEGDRVCLYLPRRLCSRYYKCECLCVKQWTAARPHYCHSPHCPKERRGEAKRALSVKGLKKDGDKSPKLYKCWKAAWRASPRPCALNERERLQG